LDPGSDQTQGSAPQGTWNLSHEEDPDRASQESRESAGETWPAGTVRAQHEEDSAEEESGILKGKIMRTFVLCLVFGIFVVAVEQEACTTPPSPQTIIGIEGLVCDLLGEITNEPAFLSYICQIQTGNGTMAQVKVTVPKEQRALFEAKYLRKSLLVKDSGL
jgi:hypothetical protein